MKYITYDPNYNYDDDNGMMDDDAMETEEDDDDDNDEYSDDDDMSWKVRRSAAKCLEAVIATRHEMLAEFYKTVSPALIARFKGLCFRPSLLIFNSETLYLFSSHILEN